MKNKKIIAFLLVISLIASFGISVRANSEYSWFVKRNGNRQPVFSVDEVRLRRLNAYYIDRKVNDESEEKVIYLTFDVGYENGNTEKILDTLKEKQVPAAFFILDNMVLRETELVKRMADEGHLVCNHTKNHKNICNMSESEIKKNITDLEKIYTQKTGRELSRYFRFPEGKYSFEAMQCVSDLGYKTVFWSLAYADWDNDRQPRADFAIKKLLSNTHNGAVVLLHSTSSTNAEIMPTLIDKWREAGYKFLTLDDLTA